MSVQADAVDMIASFAGVFDVKVKLPAGTPTGNDVPVTLELPGRENALATLFRSPSNRFIPDRPLSRFLTLVCADSWHIMPKFWR